MARSRRHSADETGSGPDDGSRSRRTSSSRSQSSRSRRRRHSRRNRSRPPREGIRRLRVWLPPLLILLVAGAIAIVLGRDVSITRAALDDATGQAQRLQVQLADGDTEAARSTLTRLQTSTARAASHTDGPLWDVSAALPWLGRNADAVQTSAASVDDIAQRALPPLVTSSRSLDADLFKPEDGRFPLKAFAELQQPVNTASTVLTANRRSLDAIDDDELLAAVRGPVTDLKAKVATAQRAASAADKALTLAPGMLGADGERTYILLFQNNAESRATGGIPGALAVVRADGGRLTIDDSVSKDDVGPFDDPVVRLTDEEKLAFGTTMSTDLRDINLTPDFTRTAEFARAMARREPGLRADGVVSIDPVALSYALRGTGDVRVGDGTRLTSRNAVAILLNRVYSDFPDPAAQDAFFTAAAQQIFRQVLDGRGDSRKTLDGLDQAVAEHRILLWSAKEDEQRIIGPTALGGELAQRRGEAPRVGFYVSDATSSKMQYYARWSTTVAPQQCLDGDRQQLQVTSTIRSTAPADARDLPRYITGDGDRASPGTQQVGLRMALPDGAELQELQIDGKRRAASVSVVEGRPIVSAGVVLKPGQRVQMTADITTGRGQRQGVVVDTTPGVVSVEQSKRFESACR